MRVQIHIFGLGERRFDGVIARGFIRRIPICDRWTGDHVKCGAVFGQLRLFERFALALLAMVDRTLPAWDRDATARNGAGAVCLGLIANRARSAFRWSAVYHHAFNRLCELCRPAARRAIAVRKQVLGSGGNQLVSLRRPWHSTIMAAARSAQASRFARTVRPKAALR